MNYQRCEHIPSGHLKTAADSSLIFQAFLGTCLGVALYDPASRIGGLIHILLPQPPGRDHGGFPERYASTGIPVLIQELTELGCQLENLQATVAGGGFVGPVNHQDIGLDIGGRSTEIALSILKAAGIPIVKSETGGFFNCTLELNMATGETRITPPWEEEVRSGKDCPKPTIKDIVATIDHLKPIPQTALKILRMFQDSQCSIDDITHELAQDQVLSGQTLKICNSALFSGTIFIETLKDAVLLLGEGLLIQSVITAAVNSYYSQAGSSGYSLCRGGLFFHAVGVASTAEKLAEKTGRVQGKLAYTAGLLHDIGKVVLDQHVAGAAPLLFRNLSQKKKSFMTSEKELLGITHCEAGSFLAKKWQFSEGLSRVITHHHLPEETPTHSELVAVVYLADLLMERFNTGVEIEKMQTRSLGPVMDRLGISMDDIPAILNEIPFGAINPAGKFKG